MHDGDPQIHFSGKPPDAGTLALKSIGAGRTAAAAASAIPMSAAPENVTAAAAAGDFRKVRRSMALFPVVRMGAVG
jgi:hypothetical protein